MQHFGTCRHNIIKISNRIQVRSGRYSQGWSRQQAYGCRKLAQEVERMGRSAQPETLAASPKDMTYRKTMKGVI